MTNWNWRRALTATCACSLVLALAASDAVEFAHAKPGGGGGGGKPVRLKTAFEYYGETPGPVGEADGGELFLSEHGDAQNFGVKVWLDATYHTGLFFSYRTNAADLPLGVDKVSELSGHDFQILDVNGQVVISDTLPKLPKKEGTVTNTGGAYTVGTPPFSLYVADDDGVFQFIAELKQEYIH